MPNRDGTGPEGRGPTGWRMGGCFRGRGFGRGYGRFARAPTKEEELSELKAERKEIEQELEELKKRIEELE